MRFNGFFRSDRDVFIATKYIIRMEVHVKINEVSNKEMSFSRNRWCYLTFSSLFGYLSANFLVETGIVLSRFRKNHGNVVSTFQEPITWIFLSNKSAEREKNHQVCGQSLLFWIWWQKIPGIRHLVTAGNWIFLR